MEEKKSYKADLENKRTTRFLLGLVFALSVFIAVIEYSTPGAGIEQSEYMEEDIVQDLEFATDNSQDYMMPANAVAPEKATRIYAAGDIAENKTADDANIETTNDGISEPDDETKSNEQKTELPKTTGADNDNVINFRVVERLPEYPGGMTAFMKWLNANLKYPYTAQRSNKQGKVIVSFIINKDGSVTDIKLMKGIDTNLDREALRVMKMMPKWKAGEYKGKPCRTLFCIPIVFKL